MMADSTPPGPGADTNTDTARLDELDALLLSVLSQDSTYHSLKDHFLAQGKGRRPSLPNQLSSSTVSRRCLMQLYFLRQEGKTTWDKVAGWYRKMFPKTSVTTGQIEYTISKTMRTLQQLSLKGQDLNEFLDLTLDSSLVEIHESLIQIGLTHDVLMSSPEMYCIPLDFVLTNEIVYAIDAFKNRTRQTKLFFTNWILYLSPVSSTSTKILHKFTKVLNCVKTFKKNRQIDNLNVFLSRKFFDDGGESDRKNEKVSSCECKNIIKKLKSNNDSLNQQLERSNSQLVTKNLEVQVLREERDSLQEEVDSCQSLINQLRSTIKKIENSKQECKNLRQELSSVKKSKLFSSNCYMRKRIASLSNSKNVLVKDLYIKSEKINELSCKVHAAEGLGNRLAENEESMKSLEKKLKTEQTMKCRYKKQIEEVKRDLGDLKSIMDSEDDSISFRESGRGRRFNDDVRLCYMALQGDANVSADNCIQVVKIVGQHIFKKKLSVEDLPKATSAINFQNEAHVLAKHHAAQEISDCKHFTYGCDGTSRDKKHYLEQHLVLDSGKVLSLGYQEIASDDSDTLLEKCIEIFRDLAECEIVDGRGYNKDDIMKEIIRKMKCIISDRASVMKCFDKKMSDFKDKLLNGEDSSTHFLFCNAHFLLGLSNAVEDGIKLIEKDEEEKSGKRLGRDALSQFANFSQASETAALRIIRTASEVFGPRGDEKNGCRNEWLAFCAGRGVKSQFCSFRSNRFNNVFQNASALLAHKNDILDFLNNYVSHNNLKLQSVLSDLKDTRIVSIVAAISLLHIYFTEPYWQLVTSNKHYGEFPNYVKKMKSVLDVWK